MHISHLSAGLVCFAALSVAGPLRRHEARQFIPRRDGNGTNIAKSTPADPVAVVPVAQSSTVSLTSEGSATVAATELVPTSSSRSSAVPITSSLILIESPNRTGPSITVAISGVSSIGGLKIEPSSSTTPQTTTPLSSPPSTLVTLTSSSAVIDTGAALATAGQSESAPPSGAFITISISGVSSLGGLTIQRSSSNTLQKSETAAVSSPPLTVASSASSSTLLNTAAASAVASTAVSSTPTSFSREFSLITAPTPEGLTIVEPPSTSRITLVTNTFTGSAPAVTSAPVAAGASIVLTIVVPSLLSSTASIPPSSITPIPQSTLPQIIATPPATGTINADTFASNLAQAKGFNDLFASLTPKSTCTPGSIACIDSQTAICENDKTFTLVPCNKGTACFAVPMNTTAGVFVGCQDKAAAQAILNGNATGAGVGAAASSTVVQQTTITLTDKSLTLPTASPGVIVSSTAPAAANAPAGSTTQQGAQSTIVLTDKSVTLPTASPGVIVTSTAPVAANAPAGSTTQQGAQSTIVLTDKSLTLPTASPGVVLATTSVSSINAPANTTPLAALSTTIPQSTITLTDKSVTLPTAAPGVIVSTQPPSNPLTTAAPAAPAAPALTSTRLITITLTDKSLTLPTASPGVVLPTTAAPANPAANPAADSQPADQSQALSTIILHSTSTALVTITGTPPATAAPSLTPPPPKPAKQTAAPQVQKPSPSPTESGSLVTVVPVVPNQNQA